MSKIKITIKTKQLEITEIFDERKHGTPRDVMLAALKWLAYGTVFEKEVSSIA
jgi:hypothetical protein